MFKRGKLTKMCFSEDLSGSSNAESSVLPVLRHAFPPPYLGFLSDDVTGWDF